MRPRDRSLVWLALYGVGSVRVLSFVFFEILDVDGSDPEMQNFKTPITPVRAGRPHSTTEAVRRVVWPRAVLAWLAIPIDPRSAVATAFSADPLRLQRPWPGKQHGTPMAGSWIGIRGGSPITKGLGRSGGPSRQRHGRPTHMGASDHVAEGAYHHFVAV